MITPSTQAAACPGPVVVFDFDGTVALGDGPVQAYADAAFALLEPTEIPAARATFSRVLDGEDLRWPDPYAAVAALCSAVDADALQRAYLTSREALATTGLGVRAPEGLAEALDRWRGRCSRVLLTNSPATGTGEALQHLDLADRFDQIIVDGGKPVGLAPLLTTLLDGQPPHRLVSIGDHWPNDIAAALELGCVGLHVTHAHHSIRPAHARGASVTALLPTIELWLTDPDAFETEIRVEGGVS